ncbi:MAG: hypothetical protein KatS3mg025_1803 [Bacteroidia bacterium]|nr:MAG: hypothetical protein KatS3mg025_1803 [Bacteroidia bacterium]
MEDKPLYFPPFDRELAYRFLYLTRCPMCDNPFPKGNKILGHRLNTSQGFRPARKVGITTAIFQCKGCGLIGCTPLPIPSSVGAHYDIDPQTYWQDPAFFDIPAGFFAREIDIAKALLGGDVVGKRALDIGSGIGKNIYVLSQAGFDVYGIEPSKTFRDKAVELQYAQPDRLILASLEEAEFPEAFFDFITFSAVLEHLYSPDYALRKALRWLRPGGILHVEVPSAKWLVAKVLNLYYRLRGTDYVTHCSPMHPPFHLWEFSVESFKKHGEKVGYIVEKVEYLPGEVRPLRPLIRLLRPMMKLTHADMQLVVWLRRR